MAISRWRRILGIVTFCVLLLFAAKVLLAFSLYHRVERSFASVQIGESRASVIGKMGKPNYHAGKCGVIHCPEKGCMVEYVYSHPFAPLVPEYYIVSFSRDDRVIEADNWNSP